MTRASFTYSRLCAFWISVLPLILAQLGTQAFASTGFDHDANGNLTAVRPAVAGLPVIVAQPQSQIVGAGSGAGFSVVISTPSPATFQWKRENGTNVAGATGDSLYFPEVIPSVEGRYYVVVTNASGSVNSATVSLYVDTNGNSLPDTWEMTYFRNLSQTATGDFDGDGISNLDEYNQGLNPAVREIVYWIAASGDLGNAANWSRGRLPIEGDTAVINSGTFTIPSGTTLRASQVTVNVPYTAPASSNVALSITGKWNFNSSFTLSSGQEFTVAGSAPGAEVTVSGVTALNGARLTVSGGAKVTFASVQNFVHPADVAVTWWATGTNSELVFTNLATITGPATQGEYLTIQASSGGTVSFPLLTSITKPSDGSTTANSGVQLNADSSGAISAPVLASFRDNDAGPRSSITRGTTGVLALPSLIASGTLGVTLSGTALPATAAPLINTPTAKNFTASGATLGGNVSGDGGTSITERGVVFSVSTSNSNPVIGGSGVTKVTATGTTGSFTAAVTGLTQATRYSYKAYAINGLGTNYTNVDTFTTLSSDANLNWLTLSHGALNPNFSSGTTSYTANVANAVSSITITPSTSQANAAVAVRVNGGTFASVSNGNASGALSLKVGANTVEVRVTAQDGVTQKTYTVTVNRLIPPTVTAPTATNITATGATLGGNVTSDGGSTITERGIVIATTATNVDPVINGTGVTKIPTTGTTGIFTLAVIQMTPETGYSYKAYAINGGGVSYSPVADFTTPSNNADLSNLALSSGSLSPVFASGTTTYTTAVPNTASSINVTATAAHANAAIQARVNGGTYASVTSGNASGALPLNVGSNTVEVRVTAQAGNTKTYTVTLTRAASLAAPTVTAPTATSITATGATLSGNVTSDNGAAITERGVVYSVTATNSNPLIGGTGVTKVTATGTIGGFTVQVSGLTQGGSYSYRAYAISSQGTAYTSVATFTVAAGWRGTQLTTVPNAADGIRNGAVHSSWYLYYYKGTDSNVWCTYWTGTQWTQVQLTSDANVDDWLTFGTPWNLLCYKGKDNKLWALYWSGAAWVTVALGTNTTVAGDVVIDDGWNIIYYRGSDSRVWAVQWNGVRWTHTSLGGTATVRGSLAVDDKNHLVYYRGNDNQVWCYSWTGTVWVQVRLTTTANVGGAVAADKAGGLAYYRSAADNSAWCTYWTGTVWSQVQLDAQAGMSAGNSIAPYGPYVTLYLTSGGQCAVEYWNGTAWGNVLLGDGGAGLTGGLSLHPATKWVFARRSDGQVVVFYYQ